MSWGYHSDDGRKFNRDSHEQGLEYADTFTTGDTIGCGVDFKEHTAYFTKNRKLKGQKSPSTRGEIPNSCQEPRSPMYEVSYIRW
jgi:hypothetical protein